MEVCSHIFMECFQSLSLRGLIHSGHLHLVFLLQSFAYFHSDQPVFTTFAACHPGRMSCFTTLGSSYFSMHLRCTSTTWLRRKLLANLEPYHGFYKHKPLSYTHYSPTLEWDCSCRSSSISLSSMAAFSHPMPNGGLYCDTIAAKV